MNSIWRSLYEFESTLLDDGGKRKVIRHKVNPMRIAETRKLKYGDRGAVPGEDSQSESEHEKEESVCFFDFD